MQFHYSKLEYSSQATLVCALAYTTQVGVINDQLHGILMKTCGTTVKDLPLFGILKFPAYQGFTCSLIVASHGQTVIT